ncbi:MAG TPA: ATP-binding protein [Aquabacterium sp.]|uniref:hybrid sensor histidine kinase/response regulator n=1 Tax=Aquabacterium sp. TaxID=1872578 RepID=UPI002E32C271|nr:ATP-binding protein [Aquabacterium sp.]HEX5356176.1 ATP-binding protein [Aquabacterium sp.]
MRPALTPDPAEPQGADPLNELAALRAQVARYQSAFHLSAPGQALVGLDGRFLEVNASLCDILGYPAETLLTLRFHDISHPDDIADDNQAAADLRSGKLALYRRQKRYLRPDGQTVWAEVTSRVARDEQGRSLYFATVVEDITERKAAEQALKEREALLSSMGKFVPGLIHKIGFDAQGRARFLYLSDRAMEMFELPHEMMERDYYAHHTHVHPDDLAYVRRLATAPKPGALLKPVDFEYRVVLPSKGLRVYGGHAIPVTEEDGSVVWYGHTADLTDKKALQEARMAARVAQDANRAKNEFLSRVSHELRTPLNAVIGFAQLLRLSSAGQLNAEQLQQVAHIENAGSHLLGIISDVLDLSRIEAGNLPLATEACRPSTLLSEACHLVGPMASERGIAIRPVQAQEDPAVCVDPIRLRQVLVNLLSNAIKYNRPQGQVTPRIWREGDQVAIAIDDTGVGLSEAQQQHLFEPFNRLGAEATGIEGTGIGLVIVRKLLEAMHGRLEVRSQPGQGSSFIAWVPCTEAGDLPQAPEPAANPQPRQAREVELVMLYAEDNDVNIELVREVLKLRPGCLLLVAGSGKEALQMAHAHTPDVFLLDMHLGDMSGFELASRLAQDPQLAAVPRVAFSADAMPDQIHRAREHGFSGYLTKPLNVHALLNCVDEHTERVRGR